MKTKWQYGLKGARSISYRQPIIFENRAFVTINHGQGSNFNGSLISLDLETGKELWRYDHTHYFAEPTVSTDGYIYISSFSGRVFKFDIYGKLCWETQPTERNLRKGVLHKNSYVYAEIAGGSDTTIALDCLSGEVKWKYNNGGHCYGLASDNSNFIIHSSAVSIDWNKSQYFLHCTEAITGKLIWRSEYENILFCPIIFNDFVCVGSRGHIAVFDLRNGSLVAKHKINDDADFFQQPIITDEAVFFVSDQGHLVSLKVEQSKTRFFKSKKIEFSPVWEVNLSSKVKSNIVYCDHEILVITENGYCHLMNSSTGNSERAIKLPRFKEAFGFCATKDGILVAISRDCARFIF